MNSGTPLPKRLLLPTDFSSYAFNALRQAMAIASAFHASVILLHVIDEQVIQCVMDFCLSDAVVNQIRQRQLSTTADKLQREINGVLESHGGVDISWETRTGIPYDEILKAQQEMGIDLIVMASHGKTGIVRNLVGSVAERVLRDAKCPVLLIRN